VRRADNRTKLMCRLSSNLEASTSWIPQGPVQACNWIALRILTRNSHRIRPSQLNLIPTSPFGSTVLLPCNPKLFSKVVPFYSVFPTEVPKALCTQFSLFPIRTYSHLTQFLTLLPNTREVSNSEILAAALL
jgi:hypothetical protein